MADRNFDELQILGREKKVIAGSFRPNGASAVDNTLNTGKGFSVARTGVGAFTITLEDKYTGLDAASWEVQLNAAADWVIVRGATDVSGARTIAITHRTGGAAADIASNANNRIGFVLFLANSAVYG